MRDRNWIRTFAVLVGIVGGIGSFIAGHVFALPDLDLSTYSLQTHYNWIAVLAGVGSTILTTALFLALASILDQQKIAAKDIADFKNGMEAFSKKEIAESSRIAEPTQSKSISHVSEDALSPIHVEGALRCSECGKEQLGFRTTCWSCGAPLLPLATNIVFDNIICPKCGFEQEYNRTDCLHCGHRLK